MYTGDSGVTLLNFDDTLKPQDLKLSVPHEWVECSDIPGLRGMCDPFAAKKLRRRLQQRRYRGVTLIGSGLYHHVSYFLLAEIRHPFTLVLFDHHTDLGGTADTPGHGLLTCGSWVSWALHRLSQLRRVVIVGAVRGTSRDRGDNCRQPAMKSSAGSPGPATHAGRRGEDGRSERTGDTGVWGMRVCVIDERMLARTPAPRAVARWLDEAAGRWPVYVSVDKDVLCSDDAATDWDSGTVRLGALLYWLVWLRRTRQVVGVDICGEWPASPVNLVSDRTLAQIRKNQAANQAILRALFAPPAGLAG